MTGAVTDAVAYYYAVMHHRTDTEILSRPSEFLNVPEMNKSYMTAT